MFGTEFLYERILGALFYCVFVLLFSFLIYNCRTTRGLKAILFASVFVITLMSFLYVPSESTDVYRWNQFAKDWQKLPFDVFLKNEVISSSTPLGILYIYYCGITHIPGMLSGLTALIAYSCIFYSIYLYNKHANCSGYRSLAVVFAFVMCGGLFISVISGIRASLAFSLIYFSYSHESVKGKGFFLGILISIIASLIHSAAIPIIALRYFSLLFNKKSISFMHKILIVFVIVFVSFMFVRNYISDSLLMYDRYSNYTLYFSAKAYISSIVIFIADLTIILIYFFQKGKLLSVSLEHIIFTITFVVFELFLMKSFVMFARFRIFFNFLLIPFIFSLLNNKDSQRQSRLFFSISTFCLISLFVAYTCGDLSAYKFF